MGLLAIDALVVFFLAGGLAQLFRRRARPAAAAIAFAILTATLMLPQPSQAQDDASALRATLQTRLAYVITGNDEVDRVSRAGLQGLTLFLAQRTALEAGDPVGIDPGKDELAFYPLIYWPVVPEGNRLTPQALLRTVQFLRSGGMILFDTRDAGAFTPGLAAGANSPTAQRLREILRPLNLAALVPMPNEHVLTRSFYLLREFPGRWTGGAVWIEQIDDRINDGVSSVIIGANDWAAAWAVDAQGRHLYPTVPGGEAQRELAIRFGVNVVMYALTGNYKADQVHIEAIMERLRR
jgi:hypothetical protein